jgi:hypothetical protein
MRSLHQQFRSVLSFILVHKVWQIHFRGFSTCGNPGIGMLISKTKRELFTVESTHQPNMMSTVQINQRMAAPLLYAKYEDGYIFKLASTQSSVLHIGLNGSQLIKPGTCLFPFHPFQRGPLLTNPWTQSSSLSAG